MLIENEIEEHLDGMSECPHCGHWGMTAHIEDDGGYKVDLRKDPYCKVTPNNSVYDPCYYVIIKCNKCNNIVVDDIL